MKWNEHREYNEVQTGVLAKGRRCSAAVSRHGGLLRHLSTSIIQYIVDKSKSAELSNNLHPVPHAQYLLQSQTA